MTQVHRPGAQEGIAKRLHDRRHRVGQDHPPEAFGDGRNGVDDRRGVHEQRYAKGDEEAQVAVFGGQRGNDDTEAQAKPCHHKNEKRGKRDPQPVRLDGSPAHYEIKNEGDEEHELDQKGDQVGDQDRDRHRHAREIDLAEQVSVLHKGLAGLGQASRKVRPDHRARHIKEELGQSVGGQAGHLSEDEGECERRQQRLDQIPQRPENGLFVDGHEVAPYEEHHQVAIVP